MLAERPGRGSCFPRPCRASSPPGSTRCPSRGEGARCRTRPWSAGSSGSERSGRERWTSRSGCTRSRGRSSCAESREARSPARTSRSFGHALVRDVAYEQIPRAERADKHLRAAEWIESLGAPRITPRCSPTTTRPRSTSRAPRAEVAELAGRAARRAATRRATAHFALYAFAAAARFYGRALELWPPTIPHGRELLLRLARALVDRRGTSGEDELLEEAREAAARGGDREGAAEAEALLADGSGGTAATAMRPHATSSARFALVGELRAVARQGARPQPGLPLPGAARATHEEAFGSAGERSHWPRRSDSTSSGARRSSTSAPRSELGDDGAGSHDLEEASRSPLRSARPRRSARNNNLAVIGLATGRLPPRSRATSKRRSPQRAARMPRLCDMLAGTSGLAAASDRAAGTRRSGRRGVPRSM